jgi:hypothetical protein
MKLSGRVLRNGAFALVLGIALLGVTSLRASSPDGNIRGLPWSYTHAVTPCYNGNPFNGCGFTIDLIAMSFDLVFWVLVGVAVVSGTDLLLLRRHHPPPLQ